MRIAVVTPGNPTWPKQEWVAMALRRLGHDVRLASGFDAVKKADAECDLILHCQKGGGCCDTSLIEFAPRKQAFWGTWHFDLLAIHPVPLAAQPCVQIIDCSKKVEPTNMLRLLRCMDMVTVKEREMTADWERLGVTAEWLDQGCPRNIQACEHRDSPEWDVLVFGSMGSQWRQRHADVARLCDVGLSVAWVGHAGGVVPPRCSAFPYVRPMELPGWASRAKITLGVDYRHDLDGYWSDRLWLALGMGSCHLRRWSPGLPPGLSCLVYSDHDELVKLADMAINDKEQRQQIGDDARRWVMDYHTIDHRCCRLLELCERHGLYDNHKERETANAID